MPAADARKGDTAAADAAVQRPRPNRRPPQYTEIGHSARSRYSDQRNTASGSNTVPINPETMEGRLW